MLADATIRIIKSAWKQRKGYLQVREVLLSSFKQSLAMLIFYIIKAYLTQNSILFIFFATFFTLSGLFFTFEDDVN